jgi:ornithine cyclodeaminase
LCRLPGVEVVQIVGLDGDKVEALTRELVDAGIPATALDSIEAGVRSADIVCAATHADSPVLRRDWLAPGTHVNSVGYHAGGTGEIDAETVRDALVVVEARSVALAEPPAGAIELHRAITAGVIDADHIHAELGQLLSGDREGRIDDSQLTLYKSVGVAAQDAAAAALVLEGARRIGAGTHAVI